MSAGQGLGMILEAMKKLGMMLLYAAIGATILTLILIATGFIGLVPQPYIVWINFTLPAWVIAWFGLFFNLVLVLIIYQLLAGKVSDLYDSAKGMYSELPNAGRALVAGIPFAIVMGLTVVASHLLASALSIVVRFAVPLIAWVLVSVAAFLHLRPEENERLGPLLTRFSIGIAVGYGFAAVTILFDRFVDAVSLPGSLPLVVFLLVAPVAAAILVRSAQRERGYLSTILIKTGFAQVRKIQTLTVAVALGLLMAVMGALLVSAVFDSLLVTLLVFLFVWVIATFVALRWFQRTDVAYGDLIIVDIQDRSSGDRRELTVTNRLDERVDLREAKIRDTQFDLYRTNIDVLLGPGQTETFDIPPNFSLFPRTDDVANDLPLGFSVSQSADTPVIVTRDGKKFKLRWEESAAEAAGYTDANQQVLVREERREDNA